MNWSKLKSLVEGRQARSVRARVTLHQARYRRTQEEVGRVWLAVDGRQVASFTTQMWQRVPELADKLLGERRPWGVWSEEFAKATADAQDQLRAAGEVTDAVAIADLEGYLSSTVEDALASPSPLVRGLAMLDARLGKRRLRAIRLESSEHPLVREMYVLRCEAEGLGSDPSIA